MTPQQRIQLLEKELHKLKLQLAEGEETPEEFFNSIFSKDLTRKVSEKYPNSQFYFDGETLILEIEKSGENLYVAFNYLKFWVLISTKNNWNHSQTKAFLEARVEEHFKLRDVTVEYSETKHTLWVEEHFKLRDVTPEQQK